MPVWSDSATWIAIAGVISAITALIGVIKHRNNPNAHPSKTAAWVYSPPKKDEGQ